MGYPQAADHALTNRGGLASALNESAAASAVGIELADSELPVPEAVAAACEQLPRIC
jgi:hydrogenase expression/formation protein HypE